jgi:hypothetical protein
MKKIITGKTGSGKTFFAINEAKKKDVNYMILFIIDVFI